MRERETKGEGKKGEEGEVGHGTEDRGREESEVRQERGTRK